ncbi:MAG: hypothetical protein ABR582_12695 [Gemmatimonadaceae bacterium]
MKNVTRIVSLYLLGACALTLQARAQGDDMAYDFKMTDSGTVGMQTINGVSTGHAIASKGKVRMDVSGTARALAMPGSPGGDITIIMLDSGKTIIYVNPKTKQYMQINPMEMMDRMQKMMEGMGATMTFNFTGEPKVENLGAGPEILGHKTQHYRMTTAMKMTMNAMGESQTIETNSITDEYLAPDIKHSTDLFSGMSSGMSGMMGGSNKEYLEKIKQLKAKLPDAMELRAETQSTVSMAQGSQSIKNVREVTAIRKTKVTPDQFAVPTGYTKVDLPMGPGAPPPG